jgi:putative acyl-CoA dehydrogenase
MSYAPASAEPGMGNDAFAVRNQPGAPRPASLWETDVPLREAARAARADAEALGRYGAALAGPAVQAAARAAERHPPQLERFDRSGARVDRIEFHPGYHELLALGLGAGYAAAPWTGGRHATHAAMVYLASQVEPGTCCPMTMTYAAWPALKVEPSLAAFWRPRIEAAAYDPAPSPAAGKRAVTFGMAMTERQGGSDVRANATRARPADGAWRLDGHKWFCSAPMSDAFLTLAQTDGGLTCFLVPRWRPDGRLNDIHLMRLKDKLGNRANASAEIEYHGALAERLGEEGQGVRTIVEMVHHTRLDTALAPAGLMRAALAEAWHWAAHRTVFQRRLIDQPLMAQVLADLALDWEGALALGMRVAGAFDGGCEADRAYARIGVAIAKFHANKLCTRVTAEAMEALGGMGYVEDTPLPMLYREAPLNGIWEGSGNVIALDILRTLGRLPFAGEVVEAEMEAGKGLSAAYDAALSAWRTRWRRVPDEAEARAFVEDTALLLAAAALARTAPSEVAEAFAATRLSGRRVTPGALDRLDARPLLARLAPG